MAREAAREHLPARVPGGPGGFCIEVFPDPEAARVWLKVVSDLTCADAHLGLADCARRRNRGDHCRRPFADLSV